MEIITIKDCSVAYRNFRGIGGDYNNEGIGILQSLSMK